MQLDIHIFGYTKVTTDLGTKEEQRWKKSDSNESAVITFYFSHSCQANDLQTWLDVEDILAIFNSPYRKISLMFFGSPKHISNPNTAIDSHRQALILQCLQWPFFLWARMHLVFTHFSHYTREALAAVLLPCLRCFQCYKNTGNNQGETFKKCFPNINY